jgi:hypothetical protein
MDYLTELWLRLRLAHYTQRMLLAQRDGRTVPDDLVERQYRATIALLRWLRRSR